MNKCRYVGREGDSLFFKRGNIYRYLFNSDTSNLWVLSYPYYIYPVNSTELIATWSKDYFDVLFIDIKEERKLKLKKLRLLQE